MPLNKLENFIKNYEGRILYVNSNDLDATDSITNQGNSLTKPFKTIQRALLEAARFSFVTGKDNDRNDRTTILVFPGEHLIDNRPGYGIRKTGTATAEVQSPSGQIIAPASDALSLTLETNFDLTQEDNILYKFNSIHGGVILPRGTSLVGLDLRKTKIRPKYVPNPTDEDVPNSAIFRITGNCYFWQFSLFDADPNEIVYTNDKLFTPGSGNLSLPTFSHHKLTCFEYADGVNVPVGYDITDLDMYYAKLSQAFNEGSGRQIPASQKFPLSPQSFAKERPEWEIVGAFGTDPINISSIISGDGATPTQIVTVTTETDHGLTSGTPIKVRGVNTNDYNVSTVVQTVSDSKTFTYLIPFVRNDLDASPSGSATVTIETDTVKGSSPYIFNCSLRSTWGLNGMKADGRKASGFKSMVVAQFTAVSLQKDDRAFVKYDSVGRAYTGIPITPTFGSSLSSQSASTTTETVYHLDSNAIYRPGWESSHIKITNDAFIQVVSVFAIGFNKHFDAQSGGDGSITNSNSNFGQYSLASEGFKKEAFSKDDNAFITSIITPRYIPPVERNIDWVSIDVGLTTAVGLSNHLYLFGFNTEDNIPPNLLQGYRVGAKVDDDLHLVLPNGATKKAKILMVDNVVSASSTVAQGTSSAYKQYNVSTVASAPNYDTLFLASNHTLLTGSKILMISEDGDLPENIIENKIYYVIKVDNNKIKIASSFTNATNNIAIRMYGGSNLKILSRLSDINSGEFGSPIQWDPNRSNWFVNVDPSNEIYPEIQSLGVVGFEEPRTEVTFIKRIEDARSLDEKIYKVRIVVPKESVNAKNPQEGFVLQESSSTGAISDDEFSLINLTSQNYNYKRNPRFISTCSEIGGTVTIVTELPHNLTSGDRVLIKNVKSSTNLTGIGDTGYNGDYTVNVLDEKTFTYSTIDNDGITHNVGIFSSFTQRDVLLPRFERNDLKTNFYIYRIETLTPYIYNVQDGVYHAYVLNSNNAVSNTFTDYKYSQNIVNLYPQKDPDNINDNPGSSITFAKRAPLGEVVTNDLKKSVTRESLDLLVTKLGVTPIIQSVTPVVGGISTITTTQSHGLNGIVGYTTFTSGTGYNIGTYFNVRLLNQNSQWNGATAQIVVSGAGSSITSLQISDGGAGYASTTLTVEGFSGSTISIASSTISSSVDNSLQVTGLGTATDGLYRILDIPGKNQISIAKTSGDSSIIPGQYVLNVSPSIIINSTAYTSTSGIATVACASAHGLVAGNKIRILDSTNNNIGDFIIIDTLSINSFTFKSTFNPSSSYRILKHGFASNDLISESGTENLAARGVSFYANETAILLDDLSADISVGISTFSISVTNSGISTVGRFPLGSYIQVNNEIMRVASSSLSGSGNNKITALRGIFGTQKFAHSQNSLIKKIKPIPVEFRRPSILRASGHTFEYLGYGPGNYSTGLPQIQARTLTEKEDFLSQSQEKACGAVVYTGMNSDGDFFIGNTKYSSASGEQTTFDIPIPTTTGQDPSRLSAVFDEVIVKERILVEGGKSKKVLSQFDGPVTFNENVIINNSQTKINGELITTDLIIQKNVTNSSSPTTGSITTKGGIGVLKSVNIGGDLNITGVTTFNNEVSFNSGLVPDSFEDAYIGSASKPWASAWIAGIGIATEGVPGGTEVQDRTINAWTGDLVLTSQAGIVSVTDNLEVTDDLLVKTNSRFVGVVTFQADTRHEDNDKALFGTGGDLEIFHDGSDSYIRDVGVGNLFVDSVDGSINLRVNGTENSIVALENSGVELYFDGSKKLETTFHGTNITGITTSSDGFFPLTDSGAPLGSLALSFSEAFVDNLKLDGNTLSSTNTNGNILLTANGTGEVIVNNGIVPDADEGAYLGTSSLPWSELHVGELQLAVGTSGDSDNIITTATGNLFLDSAGGTTKIDDNLWVTGTLRVDSTSSLRDSVVIEGSSKTLQLKDSVAGTTRLQLSSSDGSIEVNTNKFTVAGSSGNTTIAGTLTVNGSSIILGDATSDTLTVNANSEFNGAVNVDADFKVRTSSGTDKFIVSSSTGNTNIEGTLTVNGQTVAGGTTIDNIQIGITNDNTIDTSTGNLTIDSAGGTTTISDNLSVSGNLTVSGNTTLGNANTDVTTVNGELRVTQDIIAFSGSDQRLKDNITPIENSLKKVLSISGNTYTWNEKSTRKGNDVGVIAQEVLEVLPEAVITRDNGYLAVDYQKLVPLLIESIKELNSKVEELEQKLSDK